MKVIKPFMNLASYIRTDYPTLIASLPDTGCQIENLGKCSDGINDIYGIWYGDLTEKPVFFVNACIHGSEWQATHYSLDFMKRIAHNDFYDTEIIDKIRNNLAYYCIVCVSPYGYINSSYVNYNKVNLNRNFDNQWEKYNSTDQPMQYKGTSPFSEPETQIIRDKINELKPFVSTDCHTGGGTGGMGTGKYSRRFWPLLYNCYKSVNASFNKPLPVQEWNSGDSPTFTGWSKNQVSKNGTGNIVTTIEQNTVELVNENYGLTALFTLAIYAEEYLSNRNLIVQ